MEQSVTYEYADQAQHFTLGGYGTACDNFKWVDSKKLN